jgi:hypothetical protein
MLPDGFSDLVKLVISNWERETLPTSFEEIWDAFLYQIFLADTVRSAQATYIKGVLDNALEFNALQTIENDPIWSKKVLKIIDSNLIAIAGTPGDGYKRGILHTTRKEVEELRISRTIGGALKFFSNKKIDTNLIASLQNDKKRTSNLVADFTTVFGVGYVKGVLWLYSCGIAKDIVPPNGHIKNFLRTCGYPEFKWSNDPDRYSDWQVFALANKCMDDVASTVSTEIGQLISPKQAQFAAWYLQTCKGLLPRGNKLTPQLLIEYLDWAHINMDKLEQKLDDVESLDDLATDLKRYLDY